MPVAAPFSLRDEQGQSLTDVARVDTMITVVDAMNFPRDFNSTHTLGDREASG